MHTKNEAIVDYFAKRVPVSRIVVNTPSTLGGIGASTALQPALTLGCGAVGGSATSDNVGPMQLINKRYVAYGQKEMEDIRAEIDSCVESADNQPDLSDINVDEIVKSVIARLKAM